MKTINLFGEVEITPQITTYHDRINRAKAIMRKMESYALKMNEKGYFLAFSGGKDSQVLYHLAKESGVKFEAHYSVTTIDPPEVVRFIRKNYPDVIFDRPKKTFLQLVVEKKILPTQSIRYCCTELKENTRKDCVHLIGVRAAESKKRSKRKELEMSNRRLSETFDQFEATGEVLDMCMARYGGTERLIISPCFYLTDKDVWRYLHENKIEYCNLYNEGWQRIGCLFCPMAKPSEKRMCEKQYPKFKKLFIRTIEKLCDENGFYSKQKLTPEQVFDSYVRKITYKKKSEELRCLKIDI